MGLEAVQSPSAIQILMVFSTDCRVPVEETELDRLECLDVTIGGARGRDMLTLRGGLHKAFCSNECCAASWSMTSWCCCVSRHCKSPRPSTIPPLVAAMEMPGLAWQERGGVSGTSVSVGMAGLACGDSSVSPIELAGSSDSSIPLPCKLSGGSRTECIGGCWSARSRNVAAALFELCDTKAK